MIMRILGSHYCGQVLLVCLLVVASACDAKACTLWGVAGRKAAGGTIIAKNRDWEPDHMQVLKMSRAGKGYACFGLYAEGGTEPGIKEGVNEKGLTVITASAGSIPKSMRDNQPGKRGIISKLLSGCADCDEVLTRKDSIFPGARAGFVMIADRKKILMVEIGLEGKYAVKAVENSAVAHSNHFLDERLSEFNVKIGKSSATRLERVSQLIKSPAQPFNTESFAVISRDQHDGPDNSLWRTGRNARTLSSWILETPQSGSSKLRVVLANPGQPEEIRTFVLDQKFWSETR